MNYKDGRWARRLLDLQFDDGSWGSDMLVTRGKIYRAENLDGILVYENGIEISDEIEFEIKL